MQKMQSITNYIEIVIYLEIYRCQHVRLSGKRKFILCYCILLSKNKINQTLKKNFKRSMRKKEKKTHPGHYLNTQLYAFTVTSYPTELTDVTL